MVSILMMVPNAIIVKIENLGNFLLKILGILIVPLSCVCDLERKLLH